MTIKELEELVLRRPHWALILLSAISITESTSAFLLTTGLIYGILMYIGGRIND